MRASYGTVGNTAINPYQTLGGLSPLVYNFGSTTTTGAYLSNASNDFLTWEYTSTANVGLDFGFFNNRLSGSIEWYKQFTNSLLLPQTLPITSGVPNANVRNIGKTENQGLEIHALPVLQAALRARIDKEFPQVAALLEGQRAAAQVWSLHGSLHH